MNVLFCLRAKIANGSVDAEVGKKLLGWINDYDQQHAEALTASERARMGAVFAAGRMADEADRETRLTLIAIAARKDALDRMATYEASVAALGKQKGDFGFGDKRPVTMGGFFGLIPKKVDTLDARGLGLRSLFARDMHEVLPGPNVHYLARTYREQAHARLAQAIETMRAKRLGLKDETVLDDDLGRALVDGAADVSEAAQAAARAFRENDAAQVKDFNAAGGDLRPRENYLPQRHDRSKVAAVVKDQWMAFITPLLKREAMIDRATGEAMSDARLQGLLSQVYETITRDGLEDVAPDAAARGGGASLVDRHAAARVLEFRNYDAWQAYNARFGDGASVFETLMQHVNSMARDTATLRLIGPDVASFRRFVQNIYAQERAALSGAADINSAPAMAEEIKRIRKAKSALAKDERYTLALFDEVTGGGERPHDVEMARRMADVRAGLAASQLGGAVITSISDIGTLMMVARVNGLEATAVMRRAIHEITTGGSEITAAQAGLVADSLVHSSRVNDAYMGEVLTSGRMMKISGAIIRASGLRRWTAALRNAFGLEMMARLANHAAKPFGDLDDGLRAAFARYGITEADWDVIRATPAWEPRDGARFIRAFDVADRQAGERLSQMINTEIDHAVIEGDPHTRALFFGNAPAGTGKGELMRSIAQYKGFPVTWFAMHFGRAFARGWDSQRLTHGALTLAAVWSFGMLSMQMKEIAAGRDPLPMDPSEANGARAWGRALLHSGGLGIYGDLIGQDKTRFGNSWAAALLGPTASLAEDVAGKFALRNIGLMIQGRETHFAGDALWLAGRYMPGSNLWHSKLAFQRTVLDQLQLMADERAPERFRRMEEEARRRWGQEFYWRPGETSAARAPDLAAIGGAR